MNIKEVIAIVNQMQADGVIEPYAIGGAVGAMLPHASNPFWSGMTSLRPGRSLNDNFSAMSYEL